MNLWKTIALTACLFAFLSGVATFVAVAVDLDYECNPNVRRLVLATGSPASVFAFTGVWLAMASASSFLACSRNRRVMIFGRALLLSTLLFMLYQAVNDTYVLYMIVHGAQPYPDACPHLFLEVL